MSQSVARKLVFCMFSQCNYSLEFGDFLLVAFLLLCLAGNEDTPPNTPEAHHTIERRMGMDRIYSARLVQTAGGKTIAEPGVLRVVEISGISLGRPARQLTGLAWTTQPVTREEKRQTSGQ